MSQRSRNHPQSDSLASDLLWGIDGQYGIAAFIGRKPREAYYLIKRGQLPVRRLGHRTIVASRSELRRLFHVESG